MTMQLFITASELTTLDFQADGYTLLDGFFPETPNDIQESITDQFQILIKGSNADDLRSKIATITLALEYARWYKDDIRAAWLNFSVDDPIDVNGTIPEWMSKIIGGMVLYDKNLDRNWRQKRVVVTIIIEHKPYWDSNIELQVPLDNGNGADNTSGLTIFNHDDGGGTSPNHHDNWVEIEAADVLGDIQGRTRLEVTNNYASNRLYTLWVGHNWTDPTNFDHILEGEDATGGSSVADAGCSGGYYRHYALASGSEADIFTWTLATAYLNACKGGFFKILARFLAAAPTSVKFRIKLKLLGTNIWQSGQVTLDASRSTQIRDLLTLRLPPWLLGQTNLQELTMILTGQQSTGSPVDVNLDFLQITPLDGWRMLECSGYGAVQNERFVDDGVNEVSYMDDGAGDNKAGILVGYGSPIALYPNKLQRLYFLMHSNSTNIAEIARTASVKLFYRPRRRTI
jgi:hypothetical protein